MGIEELHKRLAGVRADATSGLKERADELRAAAARLGAGDADARGEIRRLTHRVRGIAGSLGHEQIGLAAGRLEVACGTPAADASVAKAAEILADRLDRASLGKATRTAPMVKGPSSSPLGWKVLAFDDEPYTLDLIKLTLARGAGCEVEACSEARAALDAERDQPPDLVIADAMMPGINGLEVYAECRRRWGQVPVVILSAATPEELDWSLPDDPRLTWIRKPFRSRELIDQLIAFVEAR